MAYIGDLPNYQNENEEYEDFNGIRINNNIPLATLPSGKQNSTKKKRKKYQFGDATKAFLNEAGQGINNFLSLPGKAINAGNDILKESDAFKDGYQLGDITKTIGSTALSTAQLLGEGAIRGIESGIDAGANMFGGISDKVNTKLEKAVGLHKGKTDQEINQEKGQLRKETIATDYTDGLMEAVGKNDAYKNLIESNSIIKSDNVGGVVAKELGRQALNTVTAGFLGKGKLVQSLPMLVGSYGGGVEEAYQDNATWDQASRYGLLNAATETITEWATAGIPGLNGTRGKGLDKVAEKIIGEGIEETSKSLSKALLKSGYKLVGEGTEEALSEFINPYIKQFTYQYNSDKNILGNIKEATSKISLPDMFMSFILGATTAGIIEAPNTMIDIKSGIKNGRINKSKMNISESLSNGTNLANLAPSNINHQINLENATMPVNLSDNNIVSKIENVLDNRYSYQQSDNSKINLLNESASRYFNNSKQTHQLVDTVAKIIQDKGYNVLFDSDIKAENGNIVNAQIKTLVNGETEIRINPNSTRAGEFLIMHEVTHAIETDTMKDLVINYASKHEEFSSSLESLKQTYGTEDISNEVLADISGQLFGNQEFINNLSMEKPNIFKRIYNSIVSLANRITGNSKEGLFLKDLRNKWQEAYRNQNNILEDPQYMMTGIKGVKNAIKNDSTNQFLKDYYDKAKDMMSKNINSETIRKTTGWFQDKNGDWKFEISDNNAKIKIELKKNKTYKLGEILEHNDLYELYPKLKHSKIKFADFVPIMKDGKNYVASGNFNRLTNTITLNNNLISKGNDSVLNTLVHEIQHRIQKNEHFEQGTTSAKGMEKYKNSYGEIEARDTTIRRNFDYKERMNITPVSAQEKKIVNNENKWYPFGKESEYVQIDQKDLVEDSNSDLHSRRLGGSSNRRGLENSSFSLLKNSDGKQIDISNLKENSTMERSHYNRKYDKNNVVAYRGESESTGSNPAFYGLGLYTTLDLKYAKQYGNVSVIDSELLPDNPLKFKTQNDFHIWEQELAKELGIRKRELYSNDYGVEQYIKKLGYDGLMIGSGKDTDLISFKDSAIRYSQDNVTWQEHLEKNYKPMGTRTNMNDIKIDSKVSNEPDVTISVETKKVPIKEINQKKMENNENAIKRLTQEKDSMNSRIQEKIKEKQELLKLKKDKDSKLATQLNIQISNLNNQLQNRQLDYDRQIERYKVRNEKMNSEEFKIQEQRITKKQEYMDLAYDLTENMVEWKDKSNGLKYQINTMKRNLYDIMSKAEAEKIYSNYFEPITTNNAKSEQFIESYNNRIKELSLSKKESIATQMLGEYKYNSETLLTGEEVNSYIAENKLDYNKIKNSVEVFRSIYDELIVKTNEVLKEQGYKEIEYRKGYFPHFQVDTPQGKFAKLAKKLGITINNDSLPTDIAGLTDTLKPGKTYFKNANQRKGKVTDYDALYGFDNYIRGASDIIFHTEDIQKLRALETVIRIQYSDSSVQNELEKINNNSDLSLEQKQKLIDEEFLKINNPLPNLVTELRNYTDSLANKKDIGDRGMEHMFGRETYTIMKNVQSRVSANMVGFNISSALTNFIPITQAWGEVSTKNMGRAIKESIANQFRDDGFADCSAYLINRTKQADRLYKTKIDNINSKAGVIFESIDAITSNTIVRGKYYDNIDMGMSQEQAIRNANEFAKDIMAGRSKGDMPTIFNRKSPLVKLFTAFQLEVNNQYGYMLKDLPRNLGDEAKKKLIGAFAKMFIGAWLYNKFSESVTGRKSAFSPIDIISESVQTINGDGDPYDKFSSITSSLSGELPFVGGIMGGGRLPIQAALPSIGTTIESGMQLADNQKRMKAIATLGKEIMKPVFYVALPFGGGQLKKTIEGGATYLHGTPGSYTSSGKLRFEAKKDVKSVAQNLIFGQYSTKEAREYFEKGYAPLSKEQVKEYKDLGISLKTYQEYRYELSILNKIKGDKTKEGKTVSGSASGKKAYQIMNSKEYSDKEKNYLLSKISSSKKKVTINDLKYLETDEEIYKYFFSLNADAKEEFISNIKDYEFKSSDLVNYYQTKKEYNEIYASKKRKEAIQDYLITSDFSDKQKMYLYAKDYLSDEKQNLLKQFNINDSNYLNTMQFVTRINNDYSEEKYSNYRRQEIGSYINSLDTSVLEKAILFKQAGYSITNYKKLVFQYIENLSLTKAEKEKLWSQLY